VLAGEQAAGLTTLATYQGFQARVHAIKDDLLTFLLAERRAGRTVAAYGAAAKGNTLLNFAGVRPDLLPFVCDAAPAKQGKFMPGSHIPILPPEALRDRRPDAVLILPWNLADELRGQLAALVPEETRLVAAIPSLRVL
jgi:hypothetical protein